MLNETAEQTAAFFTGKAIEFYIRYADAATDEGAAYWKGKAEKYERFADAANARAKSEAEAAPVEAPAGEAKPAKARCAHYKSIQAFVAIAREAGLDMAAKDRCRGAVGALLGRRIASRADLTGAEWAAMSAAIKSGKLFW